MDFVPFTILVVGFLYYTLSKELEPIPKRVFFFLALITIPLSFGAMMHLSSEAGYVEMETMLLYPYAASLAFWILLAINEMFDMLSEKLENA